LKVGKKKRLANAPKDFFLNTQKSSYFDEKNVEVPRFRQCVLAGHQN
jgi:hypothetical protein